MEAVGDSWLLEPHYSVKETEYVACRCGEPANYFELVKWLIRNYRRLKASATVITSRRIEN